MEIYFENTGFLEEQGMDVNDVLKKILSIVKEDVMVFKNIHLSLVLISETSEKLEAAGAAIIEAFSEMEDF